MTIHDDVRALRLRLGLSRQVFATNLGISISGLGYYERDRVPPAEILLALASVAQDARFEDLAVVFEDHFVSRIVASLKGQKVSIINERILLLVPPAILRL